MGASNDKEQAPAKGACCCASNEREGAIGEDWAKQDTSEVPFHQPPSPVPSHSKKEQPKENPNKETKEAAPRKKAGSRPSKDKPFEEVDSRKSSKEEKEAARRRDEEQEAARKRNEEQERKRAEEQEAIRQKAEEQEKRKKEEEEREKALRNERLGPLAKPGAKLQVQLETGWADCGPDEIKQVCDHLTGGETKFPIQARGAMYLIDWTNPSKPTQANARTGKTRNMRVA